jgi:hypothetical protein
MIPLACQTGVPLTTVIGQLGGLPPAVSNVLFGYLLIRQLIPVLLIALAAHGATPTQRISLVRHHLTYWAAPRQRRPARRSPRASASSTDRPGGSAWLLPRG